MSAPGSNEADAIAVMREATQALQKQHAWLDESAAVQAEMAARLRAAELRVKELQIALDAILVIAPNWREPPLPRIEQIMVVARAALAGGSAATPEDAHSADAEVRPSEDTDKVFPCAFTAPHPAHAYAHRGGHYQCPGV